MYADKLMKLASEAEAKAEELLSRSENADLTWHDHAAVMERASFYQGQASGFRQSAYYMSIQEGTNASD